MAFFAASPTSTTRPISTRMLRSSPRAFTPSIAARMHIGTISTTASGSSQLSYSAASSRNTNTTARPNAIDRGVAGELLLQRDLGPFEAEALRQALLRDLLDRRDRLAGREAARQAQLHLGRRIQVVARHAERPGRVAERRDRADRHHVAVVVARLQVLDVAHAQPERIVRLRRSPGRCGRAG